MAGDTSRMSDLAWSGAGPGSAGPRSQPSYRPRSSPWTSCPAWRRTGTRTAPMYPRSPATMTFIATLRKRRALYPTLMGPPEVPPRYTDPQTVRAWLKGGRAHRERRHPRERVSHNGHSRPLWAQVPTTYQDKMGAKMPD